MAGYVESPVLVACWKRAASLLLRYRRHLISIILLHQHESGQAFQDHFQTWLSFKPSSWYTSPIKCQWPALSGSPKRIKCWEVFQQGKRTGVIVDEAEPLFNSSVP
ncbi:uncharacterized protein J5F26_001574 isoform 3-T3 [Ciconia maguari]